ncbi:MAG TPA: PPC domain-containing DNA-binding protein [Phnomibacter sp.]|nr:PPC domain-containing DNA-binding protein [Phnomibacter sp.]
MLQIHPLRLKPGEDLRKSIMAYAQLHQLQAACILTCVGSLTQFHIRYANQSLGHKAQGHFEIVSLVGTLSKDSCHIHISIADETGKMIGGHLLDECFVFTTAEIVLGESSEHVFVRENDGSTPWEELQIRSRH